MKLFTSFSFLVFVLISVSGTASDIDLKSDLVKISGAHNRLYFSRLHERQLPDSIIRRNIDKAEATLKKSTGQAQDGTKLLIEKSRSEVFYLEGILAIRERNLKKALTVLDSAASWNIVIKDQDISVSLADLTFISSGSISRFRRSVQVSRRNVLKMMIEDVFKSRKNRPETATIEQIKSLKEILNREILGEGKFEDESVERMFIYLVLNFNAGHKNCEEVLKYYKMLASGDYGYSEVPRLERRNGLSGNQLSQLDIEISSAPTDYEIKEQPASDDLDAAMRLAKTNCPDQFKNWVPEVPQEAEAIAKANGPKPMLVLPKIPFTKSAWNKIPVNVDQFKNLGDLERFLDNTLKTRGYDNFKYYGFEDGFAIITPIEKFNLNGKVYEGKGRFSTDMSTSINSFFDYIDKLFLAEKGHYRFIILTVASNVYSLGQRPTLDYMESLVANGNNRLSVELSQKPLNKRFSIDGYVYEFEQNEFASDPIFVKEPALTGKQHIAPLINL